MSTSPGHRIRIGLVLLAGLMLSCGRGDSDSTGVGDGSDLAVIDDFVDPELAPFTGDLDAMRDRRLIRALVNPSRTDFFVDSGHILGIQAEFLRAFAAQLNAGITDETKRIRIKYVPVEFHELIDALLEGRGDVAAAFLTVTDERAARVAFGAPFRDDVSEVVVTHRKVPTPERIEDLAGQRVTVLRGSSYQEHLRILDRRFEAEGLARIDVDVADPRLRSEDLLEFVNAGIVDRTVVDDYKAHLWEAVLDDIVVHDELQLAESTRVAWAVRPDNPQLKAAIDAFTRRAREGSLLGNVLLERYFGAERRLDDPTAGNGDDRLSRYFDLFERYGERFDFDPLALAAQAYQESQLDPALESPAGAVGLMQVLPSTAADPNVGVANIGTPEGNVHAGAKYLAFLRDRYFDDPELSEWDQRAFSWAAYNAGPRRVRKARAMAADMGLDSSQWFGHVEVAMGRLVGREPVRYVANIYRYYVVYREAGMQADRRRGVVGEMD